MELASVQLFTSEKNELPLRDITPAEAVILAKMHGPRMQGRPIGRVIITGETERDHAEERTRLGLKYTGTIGAGKDAKPALQAVFPDDLAPLPETFADISRHLGERAQIMTPEGAKQVDEAIQNATKGAATKKPRKSKKGEEGAE